MQPRYGHWIALGLAAVTSAAVAQVAPPGGYGPPGPAYGYLEPPGSHDPREGKVHVQTFVANSARTAELGHGTFAIAAWSSPRPEPGMPASAGPESFSGDGLFEAALADQLSRVGYQAGGTTPGQTIEYVVTRELIQPPEPPHSPVGGEVGVGAGTYGSGAGIGIMIDLTKPLGALIATRIEARITDTATHELLWQGQAEVLARENDKHWRPEIIASRLTAALFKTFPRPFTG